MLDFQNDSIIKLRKVDPDKFNDEIAGLLIDGERIIGCYQDIRDHVIFTDKRIISVNVQGITGKKKDFTSLPYAKISAFSVETAGTFDFDCELELFYTGIGKVRFEFKGNSDIIEIGRIISQFALR